MMPLHKRHDAGLVWDRPRIGAEKSCTTCPGEWIYDEIHGWLPSLDHQAGCAAPPNLIPAAVIR